MLTLFINPIPSNIEIFVMENGEVRHTSTIPKGADFDEFPEALIDMIDRHNIRHIWCILGPGAFTRMRIVTLALNTLKFSRQISLTGGHFFDIIDTDIPVLRANPSEYIFRNEEGTHLIKKELLPLGAFRGYGEKNDFTEERNFIEYTYDFPTIWRIFQEKEPSERLSPIYLKDPHITWSKKNTSLS